MKEETNRPKFNLVSAFIAALGVKAIQKENKDSGLDDGQDENVFAYGGLGAFYGAPIYIPKRSKFKGYMRDKSYQAKHLK